MKLKAENVSFKYPSAKEYILKDINLELDNNKIIGLIGDSGSGKSTLCKILSGYIQKYEGSVKFNEKEFPKKGFKPVQLIYQHPEKVMNPKWRTRFPQELSGGELQRFSVVRSLNPKTEFLIADEMTTMLDAITQVQILDSVLKIVKKRNMGFLLVSHDMDLVDTICDEKIYFKDINGI